MCYMNNYIRITGKKSYGPEGSYRIINRFPGVTNLTLLDTYQTVIEKSTDCIICIDSMDI